MSKILAKILETSSYPRQKLKLEYRMFQQDTAFKRDNDTNSIKDFSEFHSVSILPIENEGKIIGTLALFHREAGKYVNSEILKTIVAELKMVLKIFGTRCLIWTV